nr:DMT family transporter [uncultured Cohaesibacter sp.]
MTSVKHTISKALTAFDGMPSFLQAVLVMFIAMIGFTLQAGIVKELGQDLHVSQIIVIRQAWMIVFLLPPMLKSARGDLKIHRKDLFLWRAFFTYLSILAGFTAIIELPLATSTTISFTRTFFLTIFAVLFLKEAVGLRRIGALVVGFIGVLIIARPSELLAGGLDGIDQNLLLSLTGAALVAANQTIVRIHLRFDRPTIIVTYQAIVIGVALIPLAWINWKPMTLSQFGLMALIGVLASYAQWLMLHSFKRAEATALAPFDYLRLVLSAALGWYMFNEWPDVYTWIGAAIIFASTFYIMRREAKLGKERKLQPPKY